MGLSITDVIASLPRAQQEQVEERYKELRLEVEGFREPRLIAGKAQEDVASALNIPSVSKIEKQADMYLSTLRSYVEVIGAQQSHPTLWLQSIDDVVSSGTSAGGVWRGRKATGALF